jgi:ribbon-helix-helix CopG family protein
MKLVATADIIQGASTNRVRVRKKPEQSPQRARHRYRQDPSVRGMDTVVLSISMPVAEMVELDAVCERVGMARSHFIRQAVKQWKETL